MWVREQLLQEPKMKNSAADQKIEFEHQQFTSNPGQFTFEVDAELLGEIETKEMRTITINDYKAVIEKLYFR